MSERIPEFGPRLQIPYLAGVYLVVNALPDAALVVDGPMCSHYKIEQVQANHDIFSRLARLALPPRIVHTGLQIEEAIEGDETLLSDAIERVKALKDSGAILLVSTSCSLLIGRDLDRIGADCENEGGPPVISVKSRTLSGHWPDAWSETLSALARRIPLDRRRPAKRPRIGIVGNLYTRHEGDCKADAAQFAAWIEALGARHVGTWLSGQSVGELSRIGQADVIVSLPPAREAAKIIAKRSEARLIELPTPFSAELAERFILGLGEEIDALDVAERIVEKEKSELAWSMLFFAEQHLLHSNWLLVTDTHHLRGWLEIAADVGANVKRIIIPGPVPAKREEVRGAEVIYGADPGWDEALARPMREGLIDLAIGNGLVAHFAGQAKVNFLEAGFPSYTHHRAVEVPTLGFKGQAALVERIAEMFARNKVMLNK